MTFGSYATFVLDYLSDNTVGSPVRRVQRGLAIALINDQIGQWEGVELKSLRYAGDEAMTEENVAWLNELEGADSENPFTQVIEFVSDFHVGADIDQTVLTFEPDTDYTDYQWWLARTEGGEWQLMSMGY